MYVYIIYLQRNIYIYFQKCEHFWVQPKFIILYTRLRHNNQIEYFNCYFIVFILDLDFKNKFIELNFI